MSQLTMTYCNVMQCKSHNRQLQFITFWTGRVILYWAASPGKERNSSAWGHSQHWCDWPVCNSSHSVHSLFFQPAFLLQLAFLHFFWLGWNCQSRGLSPLRGPFYINCDRHLYTSTCVLFLQNCIQALLGEIFLINQNWIQ